MQHFEALSVQVVVVVPFAVCHSHLPHLIPSCWPVMGHLMIRCCGLLVVLFVVVLVIPLLLEVLSRLKAQVVQDHRLGFQVV